MSLTETPAAQQARKRPWAEIVYLLEVTLVTSPFAALPSQTMTLRMSDRAYRYPEGTGAPTEQWTPHIVSWGQLADALDPLVGGGTVVGCDVVVDNGRPIGGMARFSDLIRTEFNDGAYDFPFSEAKLWQVFKGLDSGSRHQLFRLIVEEVVSVTAETAILRMSGPQLMLEDFDPLPRITSVQFPTAAPSAINQSVPWLAGTVRNVPLYFAGDGIVDKLREIMTPDSPATGGALLLSTPDKIAKLPTTGFVQLKVTQTIEQASNIEGTISITNPSLLQSVSPAECIAYNGVDIPNAQLLNITRGARNTTPGSAQAGTDVFQLVEEFVGLAGVNLGPVANQALTAVYCDGMLKLAATQPTHTIEMANTTFWPPYSLTLVRFKGAGTDTPGSSSLTPWKFAIEMTELATLTDGCYPAATAGAYNDPQWRTPQGVGVMRLGVDHPCGSPFNYWEVWFRFNIADGPSTLSGGSVLLRLYNGVMAGQNALGIGSIALAFTPSYLGPIVPAGHLGGDVAVGRQGVSGNVSSGNGVEGVTPTTTIGIVLLPGLFADQNFYVDVSTAYTDAKAAGNPSLTFGLRLASIAQHIVSGRTYSVVDGQDWPAYTNRWYGIGSLEDPGTAPALFLKNVGDPATQEDGQFLSRPNAGTAAASAAEACLGLVTVDITGPTEVDPLPASTTFLDWVNGFEEADVQFYGTANQHGIWTFCSTFGPFGNGATLVPGIHNGSQHALRMTTDGSHSGCEWIKTFTPVNISTGGILFVRLHVQPDAAPSHDDYKISSGYASGNFGLFITSGQKYRIQNISTLAFADSTLTQGVGRTDRLEYRVDATGLTLRIYAGANVDGDTPDEVVTLSGSFFGNVQGIIWSSSCGAGHTGSHIVDDVGVSTIDWLGAGTVILAKPTSDVQNQWGPSSNNHTLVDDHPGALNDADYISAVPPLVDRYGWTLQVTLASSVRFKRANIMVRGANTTSGTSLRTSVWLGDGTQFVGVAWAPAGIGAGGTLDNPAADIYQTLRMPSGYSLGGIQAWNVGVELLTGAAIVGLLYANLEYTP